VTFFVANFLNLAKEKKKKKEGMRSINGFSLEKNGPKLTHDEEKNVNSPYSDKRLQQVLSF
jgi:hypothetical protein